VDKQRNNILIWLITWASLLLLVLYSPVGSPDLYKQNSYYYISNQGVVFDGSGIPNSTNHRSVGKGNNSISIPAYSEAKKNTVSYPVIGAGSESKNGNNIGPISSSNQPEKISKSSTGGDGGFSGTSGLGKGSSGSSTNLPNTGLISMSTDLSLLADNNTTRQGGGLDDPIGTSDPGGDPTGPPIPIPDGWGFLLALAVVYGIIKKSFFMRS
jgi:hypothetical protein